MNKHLLLKQTRDYVKEKMGHESTGHDWFHIERVVKMAKQIAKKETGTDIFVIELAALLHDIGDWKIRDFNKSEDEVLEDVTKLLTFPTDIKEKVIEIVLNMSYSKNLDGRTKLSLEGEIVQDADRLEALGAIGIARAFAYGGKKNREMYNPLVKPKNFKSTDSYRTANGTTINHFYEKLFLLKDLMNTETAKKVASKREKFMKKFLDEFYKEWNGEK